MSTLLLIYNSKSLTMATWRHVCPFEPGHGDPLWLWMEMMPPLPGLTHCRKQVCATLLLSPSWWLDWGMLLRSVLDHKLTAVDERQERKKSEGTRLLSHWTEGSVRMTWTHTMREREINCICLHRPDVYSAVQQLGLLSNLCHWIQNLLHNSPIMLLRHLLVGVWKWAWGRFQVRKAKITRSWLILVQKTGLESGG